jgi:hypothetical protein
MLPESEGVFEEFLVRHPGVLRDAKSRCSKDVLPRAEAALECQQVVMPEFSVSFLGDRGSRDALSHPAHVLEKFCFRNGLLIRCELCGNECFVP